MPTIEAECCGGKEKWDGQCLRGRCPHYAEAQRTIEARGRVCELFTGIISATPRHSDFLEQVEENLQQAHSEKEFQRLRLRGKLVFPISFYYIFIVFKILCC